MYLATYHKTRSSIAKVRVEVDLTKPKLNLVWVGSEDESNPLKGFTQRLEYESMPKYCRHCKLLGHSIVQCRKMVKREEGDETMNGKNIIEARGTNARQNDGSKGGQQIISEKEEFDK